LAAFPALHLLLLLLPPFLPHFLHDRNLLLSFLLLQIVDHRDGEEKSGNGNNSASDGMERASGCSGWDDCHGPHCGSGRVLQSASNQTEIENLTSA